jgi:hypothetical protein
MWRGDWEGERGRKGQGRQEGLGGQCGGMARTVGEGRKGSARACASSLAPSPGRRRMCGGPGGGGEGGGRLADEVLAEGVQAAVPRALPACHSLVYLLAHPPRPPDRPPPTRFVNIGGGGESPLAPRPRRRPRSTAEAYPPPACFGRPRCLTLAPCSGGGGGGRGGRSRGARGAGRRVRGNEGAGKRRLLKRPRRNSPW